MSIDSQKHWPPEMPPKGSIEMAWEGFATHLHEQASRHNKDDKNQHVIDLIPLPNRLEVGISQHVITDELYFFARIKKKVQIRINDALTVHSWGVAVDNDVVAHSLNTLPDATDLEAIADYLVSAYLRVIKHARRETRENLLALLINPTFEKEEEIKELTTQSYKNSRASARTLYEKILTRELMAPIL